MAASPIVGLGFTLLDNASSEVPQTEAGSPPIIASDEHHAARADVLNGPNRSAGPVGFAFFDLHLTHPGLSLGETMPAQTILSSKTQLVHAGLFSIS
jgi:hypothetical protein